MHRFFVSPSAIGLDEVVLGGVQAHQISVVLRLRSGDEILVLDNAGGEYRVRLSAVGAESVRGQIVERMAAAGEARTRITLYQGLLKADKFDWVLQKGTEIGIARFVPLQTERAVSIDVSRARRGRWERILTEAAEQSRRGIIPSLSPLIGLEQALSGVAREGGCAIIPWEEERAVDLRQVLPLEEEVHLFIGPEGGFSPTEIALARSYGARSVTLGSRILRAETAGLVAASAIYFANGDLDARA